MNTIRVASCMLLLTTIACMAGCPKPAAQTAAAPVTAIRNSGADDLTLALDSLRKLAEGADAHAAQRTIFYLNQWLLSDPTARTAWEPDRMLANLPQALRETPGMERLAKVQFSLDDDYMRAAPWLDDISYLQQNLWLYDIASRVRRQGPAAELKQWLKKIENEVGLPEAEQLATAERLFDWAICNIQLDSLPPAPKGPLATAGGASGPQTAAAQGQVGPGYGHLPLEVLLYGRGDAHERARIFILLCRQVGIDAVMLGLTEEASATPRAWIPAVLVAKRLYLFDTALGLPIPGPDGEGIAALDQVIGEPKLLLQLDVGEVGAYAVTEKDLKAGVVPLIDTEPAALSRRMQLLQAALPGTARLALAVQPSQLESKLRQVKSIGSIISLWRAPLEAIQYRIGHLNVVRQNADAAREFQKQRAVFAADRPLMRGRNLHLQGRFEASPKDPNKPSARSLYMQCRPPDLEIDGLVNNEFYRKTLGLDQALPEDPTQKKAILEQYAAVAREGKYAASYWMGLTYEEEGKLNVAIEWLGQRTVQTSPPSPWTAAARYNLARCYEQLGNWTLARQWLESDKESPQRAGNLLRARQIAKQHASGTAKNDEAGPGSSQ